MAVHTVAQRYHIDPVAMLNTWTIDDLLDAFESIALIEHYAEQNKS